MVAKKKNNKGTIKGAALQKRIKDVVQSMLLDDAVTPAQINIAAVARRSRCSRTAIYQNNLHRFITESSEKKMNQVEYEKRIARSRKPKLLRMEDSINRYMTEAKEWEARYHEVAKTLARVLINIQKYSKKLEIPIEELMIKPVEPLAFKRVSPFMKRHSNALDRWRY